MSGRAWFATAGETGTMIWLVTEDGTFRAGPNIAGDHPDVEHVVLGSGPDRRLVVGTAGPEHLTLWAYADERVTALIDSDEEWVTALVAEQIGDRLIIVTGNDDGTVRVVEPGEGDAPTIRTVHDGDSVVAVSVITTEGRVIVVSADRYGGLAAHAIDGGIPPTIRSLPWQVSHMATAGGQLFTVASVQSRLLSWLVGGDGDLRLDERLSGSLRGMPLHVARTESAVAVADGGGQVLLIDTATTQITTVNLNVTVDALAGVPGSGMFVAARGQRLICLAANPGARSHPS
jgi:hypothetical protein